MTLKEEVKQANAETNKELYEKEKGTKKGNENDIDGKNRERA